MNALRKISDLSGVFTSTKVKSASLQDNQQYINRCISSTVFVNILQNCLLKLNQAVIVHKKYKDIAQCTQDLDKHLQEKFNSYFEKSEKDAEENNIDLKTLTASESLELWTDLKKEAFQFFKPFQLACATKSLRLALVSLDCIQRLLSCGFLYDDLEDKDTTPELLNTVIKSIIQFIHIQDDSVHLQIIRCLLTAVTSTYFQNFHGTPIFSAVEAGFCIFTTTRDPQNRRTAKAALTQIINTVIKRYNPQHSVPNCCSEEISSILSEENALKKFSTFDIDEQSDSQYVPQTAISIDQANFFHDSSQLSQEDASKFKKIDLMQENGKDKDLKMCYSDMHEIFSILCKFSMAPPSSEVNVVQQKRLALEFILLILENTTETMKSDYQLIKRIRNSLCISLIKNCVSLVPEIYVISLKIFVFVASNFKDALRNEIGVFVDQILLRLLTSKNCSYEHKLRVIQAFSVLFADPVICLEFYLNFDCNVNEHDVFFSAIDALSHITQNKPPYMSFAVTLTYEEQLTLQQTALKSLVVAITALYEWVKDCYAEAEKAVQVDDLAVSSGQSELLSVSSSKDLSSTVQNKEIISRRQIKMQLQKGVNIFRTNPQQGIAFLIENNHLKSDPESIAHFFLKFPGLSKTAIGNYLGELDAFHQSVLQSLIKQLCFTDLEIDLALRYFLSLFRLPGESQKIDRMMERFAEKYIEDNPEKFYNADCAYILAFSLIMLHTDAHSRSIKPENRMSLETFIKNNRGINENENLPKEYLEELYNRIVREEWTLDEDKGAHENASGQTHLENLAISLGLFPSGAGRRKFEQFIQESSEIVRKTTELIKKKNRTNKNEANISDTKLKNNTYVIATNELTVQVKYLYESIYSTILNALILMLSEPFDDNILATKNFVELSLKGIHLCVQLAAHFEMVEVVDLYLKNLALLSGLEFKSEVELFTEKNVQCIEMLLLIAISEGNFINDAWENILECVSRLSHFQSLLWGDSITDNASITDKLSTNTKAPQTVINEKPIDKKNIHFMLSGVNISQIDLLFMRSVNLSPIAIVQFASALCNVSKKELSQTNPRFFSLQKLVEIADHNMNRIRLIWSKIWCVLRGHFVDAALHSDLAVCFYSVDSLRQLAIKFLEKGDFGNYSFQNDFLKPLYDVIKNPDSFVAIREFIIDIISNIIQAQGVNLKNGWKSALNIIAAATENPTESLITQAFKVMVLILEVYFWITFGWFNEIIHCLNCFIVFKNSENDENLTQISLKALMYMEALALLFVNINSEDHMKTHYPDSPVVKIISPLTFHKSYNWVFNLKTKSESHFCESIKSPDNSSSENHESLLSTLDSNNLSSIPVKQYLMLMNTQTDEDLDSEFYKLSRSSWLSILTNLSQVSSNHLISPSISYQALIVLFRIFDLAAKMPLVDNLLHMIFRGVLFPLFDNFHLQLQIDNTQYKFLSSDSIVFSSKNVDSTGSDPSKIQPPPPPLPDSLDHWALYQSWAALNFLVETAAKNSLHDNHLEEIIYLIMSCIENQPEFFARIGIQGFSKYLLKIENICTKNNFSQIIQSIQTLYQRFSPKVLINNSLIEKIRSHKDFLSKQSLTEELANYKLEISQTEVVSQCVMQLHLLNIVQDIIEYTHNMYDKDVMILLNLLWDSFLFARNFNREVEWRYYLKLIGFMGDMRQLPGLLRQEKEALILLMRLFFMTFRENRTITIQFFVKCVDCLVKETLIKQNLVSRTSNQYIKSEAERELLTVHPIIIEFLLTPFYALSNEVSKLIFNEGFSQVLIDLILVNDADVRQSVHNVITSKFGIMEKKFT